MVCYYLSSHCTHIVLASSSTQGGGLPDTVQFSMPPFQGWGSTPCVEKHCPLSMASDNIICIMTNYWEWSRDRDWLFPLPENRVI